MISAAAVCLSKMAMFSHGSTIGDFSASRGGLSADSRGVTDCLTNNSSATEPDFLLPRSGRCWGDAWAVIHAEIKPQPCNIPYSNTTTIKMIISINNAFTIFIKYCPQVFAGVIPTPVTDLLRLKQVYPICRRLHNRVITPPQATL